VEIQFGGCIAAWQQEMGIGLFIRKVKSDAVTVF
jgi:hypothetical protein